MTTKARFRADLEIFSRRDGASIGSRVVHWIHHPIAGTVARLPDEDFRRLQRHMEETDNATNAAGEKESDASLFQEAKRIGFVASQPALTPTATKIGWWRNPLYIKLPGIPADALAIRLAKYSGWLFSPVAITFWGLVFLITSFAILSQVSSFWKSLVQLADFQAQYWLLSLGVLGMTKVMHELGHAAVCRRMGASCREIGALFLCGTPCLFCDVSESWRVESRLGRSWIMVAGIYVEWVIASIAAWIWLLENQSIEPTFQQLLAAHVIMVCGVSTLLFNINPLMRYDGYYILSDMLNVMNLRHNGGRRLARCVRKTDGRFGDAPPKCEKSCVCGISLDFILLSVRGHGGHTRMVIPSYDALRTRTNRAGGDHPNVRCDRGRAWKKVVANGPRSRVLETSDSISQDRIGHRDRRGTWNNFVRSV